MLVSNLATGILGLQHSYMADNGHVLHVASNEDGTYLAIAGLQGLILHDVQMKKWRVFGDVCQERQVQCAGVVWLEKIVVICASHTFALSQPLVLFSNTAFRNNFWKMVQVITWHQDVHACMFA